MLSIYRYLLSKRTNGTNEAWENNTRFEVFAKIKSRHGKYSRESLTQNLRTI